MQRKSFASVKTTQMKTDLMPEFAVVMLCGERKQKQKAFEKAPLL